MICFEKFKSPKRPTREMDLVENSIFNQKNWFDQIRIEHPNLLQLGSADGIHFVVGLVHSMNFIRQPILLCSPNQIKYLLSLSNFLCTFYNQTSKSHFTSKVWELEIRFKQLNRWWDSRVDILDKKTGLYLKFLFRDNVIKYQRLTFDHTLLTSLGTVSVA